MAKVMWFVMSSSLLVACGKPSTPTRSSLQAIVGDDSMQPVDSQTVIEGLELSAIGRLTGGCTAFHLGDGLVATAAHCLPAPQGELAEAPCATYKVSWHDGLRDSRCLHYVVYSLSETSDYALIEVDQAPAVHMESAVAVPDDTLVVLGYPQDRELSRSNPCRLETSLVGNGSTFHHTCDTLPGNSGSPVYDLEQQAVIGIHDGESTPFNYATRLNQHEITTVRHDLNAPQDLPEALRFGPFADQQERLLSVIGSRLDSALIHFKLTIDLEDGFDRLVVTDGRGVQSEFTGKRSQILEMQAPVSLVLYTDYSGSSQEVSLADIGTGEAMTDSPPEAESAH